MKSKNNFVTTRTFQSYDIEVFVSFLFSKYNSRKTWTILKNLSSIELSLANLKYKAKSKTLTTKNSLSFYIRLSFNVSSTNYWQINLRQTLLKKNTNKLRKFKTQSSNII
jgi:hypothetical protein